MNRARIEFDPTPVLGLIRDNRTKGGGEARQTVTEEQREEAVQHALRWMVEHKVWIVEVLVRWTRYDATVLTVRGHAEHLAVPGKADRIIPDWDDVTEHTLDGTPIVRSGAEDQALLEAELAPIFGDQ